jgi:hypothetical protein
MLASPVSLGVVLVYAAVAVWRMVGGEPLRAAWWLTGGVLWIVVWLVTRHTLRPRRRPAAAPPDHPDDHPDDRPEGGWTHGGRESGPTDH